MELTNFNGRPVKALKFENFQEQLCDLPCEVTSSMPGVLLCSSHYENRREEMFFSILEIADTPGLPLATDSVSG